MHPGGILDVVRPDEEDDDDNVVVTILIIVIIIMLRMVTLPGDEQSSCSARQTSRKMDPAQSL